MVRNVVFEHLNHRDPSLGFVRNLCLTAETHDFWVFDHRCGHTRERVGEHLCISVDHKNNLVVFWCHTGHAPDCVEELVLKLRHTFVKKHLLHKGHQDDLGVTLTAVAGLRTVHFHQRTTLGYQNHRHTLLLGPLHGLVIVVVESCVHLGHVVALCAVGNRDIRMAFDLFGRCNKVLHHRQTNIRSRDI